MKISQRDTGVSVLEMSGRITAGDALTEFRNRIRDEVAKGHNKILIDLIKQFSRRTRRYEIALMRSEINVKHTLADHEKILRELRRGDLEAACERLRDNMLRGCAPIINWLKGRHPPNPGK